MRRSRRLLYLLASIWLGMYLALLYGCGYNVNVMGVEVTTLEKREILPAAAGALVSFAVHEAAHWAVLEYKGYEYEFEGFNFTYQADLDQSVQQAGFLSQIVVGAVLNVIPYTKKSAFTLGFNSLAAAGAISYPARYGDEGDHQGDRGLWARDSALTTANTLWTVYNRRVMEVPHGRGSKRSEGVGVSGEEELQTQAGLDGEGDLSSEVLR